MFSTAIAGSLPKPEWLAETNKLWPKWQAEGDALLQAKADATLLWIKAQEDAGLDVVGDGEQSRQHFVHGFLEQVEGIDFENKVTMGIRNNRYDAQVPQVIAPLRLKGRVHAFEAQLARAHTTVSVERAVLRLAGLSGADPEGIPWPNHLVDRVREGVAQRYDAVASRKRYAPADVAAGRAYVGAYVDYVHYVERVYDAAAPQGNGTAVHDHAAAHPPAPAHAQ